MITKFFFIGVTVENKETIEQLLPNTGIHTIHSMN